MPKPTATKGIVIGDCRPAFAEMSRRDIIGKQAGEPERVVAEMQHHPEAPVTCARLEIRGIHQVAMALIVVPIHAPRPVALSEFEQERGEIIGELSIIHPRAAERMPHDDEIEEGFGRNEHRPNRQQALEQLRRVQ